MIFWLLACQFSAVAYESVRNETRAFAINAGTEIQISNKYGNVHIVAWDKDSVRFEINLVVVSNKMDKAEKTMSEINFDFLPTSHYVIAKTVFKNPQGTFLDEMSSLANTLFTATNRVKIDYKVFVPESSPLKIENKFGNIFMTDFKERVNIILSNGDMKANEFSKELDLKIDFGSVNIKKSGDCKISSGYAEVEIQQAGKVRLDSKSSTFDFGVVESLEITSRRDKINIDAVKVIKGDLSFTDLRMDQLTTNAILTANYGKIDLQSVHKTFGAIHLTAKYTEVSLNFDKTSAFKLMLAYSKQTTLANTLDFSNIKKEVIDEKAGLYQSSGMIGSGKNFPDVNINITSGQLSLTNF